MRYPDYIEREENIEYWYLLLNLLLLGIFFGLLLLCGLLLFKGFLFFFTLLLHGESLFFKLFHFFSLQSKLFGFALLFRARGNSLLTLFQHNLGSFTHRLCIDERQQTISKKAGGFSYSHHTRTYSSCKAICKAALSSVNRFNLQREREDARFQNTKEGE